MIESHDSNATVAAIIPTIGRPDSLQRLLASLAGQSARLTEIVVADASGTEQTKQVVDEWRARGMPVAHLSVSPPNAVGQRIAAIERSSSRYLLLLDDDVELEVDCLREMLKGISSEAGVVAVVADFSNQTWSEPTRAWRFYMRFALGLRDREWEGRVVGPLLRFCFPAHRGIPARMEWIGAGTTLVSRAAYEQSGGFSDFFLHRCTMNEDVDLGLKLLRIGKILFWPAARLAHYHAPSGRVSPDVAAEDDLFNRFFVLTRTAGLAKWRAFALVTQFFLIESASNFGGSIRRLSMENSGLLLRGRLRGYLKLIRTMNSGTGTP